MTTWPHTVCLTALAAASALSCGARGSLAEDQAPLTDSMELRTDEDSTADNDESASSEPSSALVKTAPNPVPAAEVLIEPAQAPPDLPVGRGDVAPAWSFATTGEQLVDDAGNCDLFIDGANSELIPSDIAVRSGGTDLPYDEPCEAAGFYLTRQKLGLFVTLCEAQCALFAADPARLLQVHSNYDVTNMRQPK